MDLPSAGAYKFDDNARLGETVFRSKPLRGLLDNGASGATRQVDRPAIGLEAMKQVMIEGRCLSNSGSLVKLFRIFCLRRAHGCLRQKAPHLNAKFAIYFYVYGTSTFSNFSRIYSSRGIRSSPGAR